MGKYGLMVCILLLGGAAASYPAWSQIMGELYSSAAIQPGYSTSVSTSNSTVQAIGANTTEPNVFSLETINTSASTTAPVQFGPGWISQFINIVDGYRSGESLTECASLDTFAMTRFETMTNGTNWEVTHFGYAQDQAQAFGGSPGLYAEEYFYPNEPSARTPQQFATLVETTAPGHWSDLISPSFQYYGTYYEGQGPVLLFQSSCGPQELGAGINVTAAFASCPSQQVMGTWLVIELSSVCPS